jgi:hypothetical protein
MLQLLPGSARWCVEAVSFCSLMAHRESDVRKTLEELKQRAQQTYVQPLWLAAIHVALGEQDQALDRLQTAFDDRSAGLVYLKVDPDFDALCGDSRFAGLLHRIQF